MSANKFQAVKYFDTTELLTAKDWLLRIAKQFPFGGIVNNARVVKMEQINAMEGDEQKRQIKNLLMEMEAEFDQAKVIKEENTLRHNSYQQRETPAETERKPIKLAF